MLAIPNMEKPKSCYECPIAKSYLDCLMEKKYICPIGHTDDCPLIEVDDEGIQKAKECLTVIKAMWRRFKIKVNESEELKQELLGMDSNLTIIDESYGERATDEQL